jgi:glycosyltransferase involved in cell wall biosynthesis
MPVRNAGLFVVAAVDSILQQSFTDFELIIVDDASMDDSVPVIKAYDSEVHP